MATGATIDTSSFDRMVGDLIQVGGPGSNAERVFRDEVGHVLENCIRYTPMARQEVIEQRVTYRERRQYSYYFGGETGKDAQAEQQYVVQGQKNDKAWWVTKDYTPAPSGRSQQTRRTRNYHDPISGRAGRAFHIMNGNRRWPDAMWAAYQAEEAERKADYAVHLAKEIEAAHGSRGLTAQSWLEIATALGINVKVAGYNHVRHAKPSNGRTYINGHGIPPVPGAAEMTYVLQNFQPILIKQDGAGILQRALDTRVKAFDIAMEKGLAHDLEAIARRYPGLLAA